MISVNHLWVSFGSFDLLKDISFVINQRDRIGLVGNNGAGKSTLLKILSGECQPSSGSISRPSNLTTGYLPQSMKISDERTLREEAWLAFPDVLALEEKMAFLEHQIARRIDHESEEYQRLIHQLAEVIEQYELLEGSSVHAIIERTLMGLGFSSSDMNRSTKEFSGGWRMRIELAKILLRRPMLLLLDEPTNHLDIESIQWLEDFLAGYSGALVVVSHDKLFLDRVTQRTFEISLGRLYDYNVNYSAYVALRQTQQEQQMRTFRNQQKMIADTEKFIERFRYKATKASQVQSRIKQLEKLERIEIDPEDTSHIHIRFPQPLPSGRIVVRLKNVSKSYGEKVVLNKINLTIEKGEKIAFVGKNGEGKTTLARILMNELNHEGEVIYGHQVRTGYYAQNQDELLQEEETVFDTLDKVAAGEIRAKLRDILGAFLFKGEDIHKKVKTLSGGEKARLAIARLLLEPYNFLILDEPTNHLDMRSKEILKQALLNFEGTLVIISHDRDFLDNLVTKVYEFTNKNIKEFTGSIYDFLQKKKIESLKALEIKDLSLDLPENNIKKQWYEGKKEKDRIIRKSRQYIKNLEERIEKLEKELNRLTGIIASEEERKKFSHPDEPFVLYQKTQEEINHSLKEWEKASEELEQLLKKEG